MKQAPSLLRRCPACCCFAYSSAARVFGRRATTSGSARLPVTREAYANRPNCGEILAGILLFLQGFGLGGVIASFGLVLDLIGFVLFPIFVLVSSAILLRPRDTRDAGSSLDP